MFELKTYCKDLYNLKDEYKTETITGVTDYDENSKLKDNDIACIKKCFGKKLEIKSLCFFVFTTNYDRFCKKVTL